ncbi:hypothetical protein ACV4VJ_34290, partial [Pseudomonas aeruginosa]
HLLHRKALRVKSADFAKSGSLFQSFPSGQPYAVAPILGYDKELSDRFNLIANQWGGTLAGIQPWATAPTPAQARNSLES